MSEDKPCILSNNCPYLTAVCKVSEPDEGCYVYRYFKKLIDKDSYDEGMEDCWKMVKKINFDKDDGGYAADELVNALGFYYISDILNHYSAKEAKEKIDNYIKQRDEEFRVGDEVKSKLYYLNKGVVIEAATLNTGINILRILFDDAVVCGYTKDEAHDTLTKTGRHFDEVETLFNKLKEENNEGN